MKYKNILFDLDGTLTDPGLGITNSVMYALRHYGIEENDRKNLYKFIGPPLVFSFCNYYNFDKEKASEAVDVYREYFSVKGLYENEVYDGIEDMLIALKNKGLSLFVATSKPEKYAKEILRHFGLDKYFECIKGIEMQEESLPKSEVIKRVLEKSGLEKSECVMVGDRCYDINGAKENGIATVGVLYGYGNREELLESGADCIAQSVQQLQEILINEHY